LLDLQRLAGNRAVSQLLAVQRDQTSVDNGQAAAQPADGTHMGTVVNNVDPEGQNRLQVTVAELGPAPVWATPSAMSGGGPIPNIGDQVTVSFEGGDLSHPVWQPAASGGSSSGTHIGTVVNNADPEGQNRLQVTVAELGPAPVWATPSAMSGGGPIPNIGDQVTVSFEGGDLSHPVWQPAASRQ
jgi:hypothetical protein